jgi:CubicO group peptidase (beta-lactamase class C family)
MARYLVFLLGLVFCLGLSGPFSPVIPADQNNGPQRASTVYQQPEAWEWPVSTPEEQGLNPLPLNELVKLIREGEKYPRLHCLLIVRHGYLVLEEYFNGWQAEKLHTLQSVSKSFTSALVGMAIAAGKFKGVEENVLNFFPDRSDIANMDERKTSLRLKDLLTMRSGTDYHESGPDSPHFQLNRLGTGWDKFYLDRPMLKQPGTYFLYDSGGVILLSSMLKNRTGMHADAYAESSLFRSLQIEEYFWIKNREGHPHTGGGLNLRARDTAKFGLLYLQRGRWEKEQVVPEEWVQESFRKQVDFGTKGQGVNGYGYLWWILAPDPARAGRQNIAAAMGFKAQYIFVIPEHDMVVVVNGDTRSRADQHKPIEFLYSHILPSVSGGKKERD